MRKSAEEYGKGHLRLADETLEHLLLYQWPGNVRQLINEIRRVAALADADSTIRPEDLSGEIFAGRRARATNQDASNLPSISVRADQTLPEAIAELERIMVTRALADTKGRLEGAAERLGISRKGLYLKRQKLGLDADTD